MMIQALRKTLLSAALAAAALSPLRASDGRIPISVQTTISQPGYYYLTRDIAFTSGVGIYITANDVTLDLNGHTLSAPATAGIYGVSATDRDRIRVTGGRINGTYQGVYINMSAATQSQNITIDHLSISSPGFIGINVQGQSSGSAVPIHAVIEDNHIIAAPTYGIYINNLYGGEVSRNIIRNGAGIRLGYFTLSRALDNLVSDCVGNGVYLANSVGTTLSGNQVNNCTSDGITLAGGFNSKNVLKNNISSRHTGFSNGISLLANASGNVLDGNITLGNGTYGIFISGTGNIYSNNRLQSSNSIGAGNVSAGGNNAGGSNF